jgi:hypothetical protein
MKYILTTFVLDPKVVDYKGEGDIMICVAK